MRKLCTLLLAAALLSCLSSPASAVDFKAKGQLVLSFDLGQNGDFKEDSYGYNGKQDNFNVRQRTRLQLDAIASEALSARVSFEINNQWGKSGNANWGGGSLGTDGINVLVKNAYIDWIVPNTELRLRMGLQSIALPSIIGSQIQDDDAAGITASYRFNDNVTLTGLWSRMYNDNFTDPVSTSHTTQNNAALFDNVDLFALTLPLAFDGVRITPWLAYGMVGKNAAGTSSYMNRPYLSTVNRHGSKNNAYSSLYMGGITGELSLWDTFRLAAEFFYTGLDTGYERDNVNGWFGTVLAEYKLDWATPGLYVWYASGEDGDSSNGSERFITFAESARQQYSQFALNGSNSNIARDGVMGQSLAGTWGIGARLKDISFVEGLKHSLRVNYFGGTNDETAVLSSAQTNGFALTSLGNNLAMQESALEVGLGTQYQIYENLKLVSDISYIALFTDKDIKRGYDKADAWNVNVSFVYSF
ncbi:MAG: outer membrane homotrimeric porin [Desulfovibrionaceae bacterium]|nr:outer membrane homotrimeric porin [Desulfovibrionaceae bacterium]